MRQHVAFLVEDVGQACLAQRHGREHLLKVEQVRVKARDANELAVRRV